MHALSEFISGFAQESLETFKILSRNKMGLFGFVMVILIILLSIVGPLVWPPEKSANVAEINKGNSAQHWLGTDFQGQDNLRKIINSGKDIVVIALLTGTLSMLIAVVVGSFSAFVGGRVDSLLMEFVNIWLTIPKFPLLAVLATVLALKDVVMLSVLMAILDWPALARRSLDNPQGLVKSIYGAEAPRTEIASLSDLVEQAASQADPVALVILDEAARELAYTARAVYRQLGNTPVPLALTGGVILHSAHFAAKFRQACQNLSLEFSAIHETPEPALGVIHLARDLLAKRQ